MTLDATWMAHALLAASMGTAPVHFVDCADATGSNATIGILGTAAVINGVLLQPGDEIAVVTPGNRCAGAGVWTGDAPIAITVWGDDQLTEGVVEGFREGEPFAFRVWVRAEDREYAGEGNVSITALFQSGPTSYVIDGISIVSALTVPVRKTTWGRLKIVYR